MNVLDVLRERGFVEQVTNETLLKKTLDEKQVTFYIGFDPTGDSLHVGHLLPILCMAWLQKAGHKPIVVLGGGTAMVGDPSGKDKTRDMLTTEKIRDNMEAFRPQFARFLDMDNTMMLNNGDWLLPIHYIDFLRDIGKHFSVNNMIKATGTKERLEREQGFSFIEFNYHLLQSFDFYHLFQTQDCILQVGGNDQWFHFCGGVELIRKETQKEAFAFTIPLLTTSDGKKMGKTENGAVWLDSNKLSVYDFYQYWVNVLDADVIRLLKLYTFLPMEEIEQYARLEGQDINIAKQKLALEITTLAHGAEAAQKAHETAIKVFSGGVSTDMPSCEIEAGTNVIDAIVQSGQATSKSKARLMIPTEEQKAKNANLKTSVYFDTGAGKEAIEDFDFVISTDGVLWTSKKKCVRIIIKKD